MMKNILLLGLVCWSCWACMYNKEEVNLCSNQPLQPEQITFSNHVAPIISSSCALPACHVSGSEHGNFTRYDEIKQKADDGKLEFMIRTNQMPHGTTKGPAYLNPCQADLIIKWIKNGAVNN